MTERLLMLSPGGVKVFCNDTQIRLEVPKPVTPEIAAEVETTMEILNMVLPFETAGIIVLDDQQVLYGLDLGDGR